MAKRAFRAAMAVQKGLIVVGKGNVDPKPAVRASLTAATNLVKLAKWPSLETEQMRLDRSAVLDALIDDVWTVAVEHFGKREAQRRFHAKIGRIARGPAKADALSRYDNELQRLYCTVRGERRRQSDDSPQVDYRLAKVMRLAHVPLKSLPRKIAERLCEEHWHPDVLEIFGGTRPKIFTPNPTRIETVTTRIGDLTKCWDSTGMPIEWPPWPPGTDK